MITITPMTADQYDQVVALWLSVTEIGFSPSFDTRSGSPRISGAIPATAPFAGRDARFRW